MKTLHICSALMVFVNLCLPGLSAGSRGLFMKGILSASSQKRVENQDWMLRKLVCFQDYTVIAEANRKCEFTMI